MVKHILTLTFFILFSSNVSNHAITNLKLNYFDSYCEATLHFLDGTSIKGYAKIIDFLGSSKIKFKLTEEGKADSWDDVMVKGVTFHAELYDISFHYVKIKHIYEPKLLEVIELGEISVYAKVDNYWVINFTGSQADPYSFPSPGYRETSYEYFVKKQEDLEAINLSASIGFKKAAKEYFENCPGIIEKINSREFNSSNIVDMVYYYNDFCAEL